VLGTSDPDIVAAILAQWTCEKGADPYPPARDNPGNLARGAAQGLGVPFRIEYPNPQPGNPIVTFATPELGATAYGRLVNSGARYAAVRAAARAGDGHAYIVAMGASGYGTGTACMLSAYRPPAPPTDTPPPGETWMIFPQVLDHIITTGDPTHIYSAPDLKARVPSTLPRGKVLARYGHVTGWQFVLITYGVPGIPQYAWLTSDQVDPDPTPLHCG
jgi:hypothetical protein